MKDKPTLYLLLLVSSRADKIIDEIFAVCIGKAVKLCFRNDNAPLGTYSQVGVDTGCILVARQPG